MINIFHLWGSRRCRRMGVTLLDRGVTLKGDMLLTTTRLLSQSAEPLAVVVGDFPKMPHWRWCGFSASAAKKRCEALPRASLAGRSPGRHFALTVDECLFVWLCSPILVLCVVVCLLFHLVLLQIRVSPETRQPLQPFRTERHLNVGSWLRCPRGQRSDPDTIGA